jgi:hypothetical protein
MSLLTICQAVAREVSLLVPATIIDNDDPTATRLLSMAHRSGQKLSQRDWKVLTKEHTFTSSSSTANYALPSDYNRMVQETAWSRTDYLRARQLDPQDWQRFKSGLGTAIGTAQRWRIVPVSGVRKFSIDNPGTGGKALVFEYVTDNWCMTSGSVGLTDWTNDTDVPVIDAALLELDMIWRTLRASGRSYAGERQDAMDAIEKAFAEDMPPRILNLGASRHRAFVGGANIPDSGFG